MDLYDMPWTHSLVGALAWSAAFAVVLRLWLGDWVAGAIGGAVVFSHWMLDLLVHIPDLTIAGAPPKFGFALWNHPVVEMPVELGLLLAGAFVYVRATRPTGRTWLLPLLMAVLAALQAFNWFGPQPVEVDAGVWALGLFAYALTVVLAAWTAINRTAR